MIDYATDLVFDGDALAAIKRTQVIPDEHLKRLAEERETRIPGADFRKVASIPAALVDHWKREGFDVFTASAKEIVARLRRENLDAFVVHGV